MIPSDTDSFLLNLPKSSPHASIRGIHRIHHLASLLNLSPTDFPSIHIAGTNGKGSTAAMLDAILHSSLNLKTALFTSPHLIHLSERIQINRAPIPQNALAYYTNLIQKTLALHNLSPSNPLYPTFFEWLHAIAHLYFRDHSIDIAIIETGLGGQFDSTNFLSPLVSIITSIGFDHMEILGNSLQDIARAKAGIIKPNTPVVLGNIPTETLPIFQSTSLQQAAPLYSIFDHFSTLPSTNLHGHYQSFNAACALLASQLLPPKFRPPLHLAQNALLHINWPGRWQSTSFKNTPIILDVAHNPHAIDSLLLSLPPQNNLAAVFSSLQPWRAQSILEKLAPHVQGFYLIDLPDPRALPAQELSRFIPKNFPGFVSKTSLPALFQSLPHSPQHSLLILGSFPLIGQALQLLPLNPS